MKYAVALATALSVAAAGSAMARPKQINFISFSGPTGCGMSINFSDVVVFPGDPPSLAAGKPTGTCAKTGVAIGGIGTAHIGGEDRRVLSLGQNLHGKENKNTTLFYAIELNANDQLESGRTWAQFNTTDGKTVNLLNAGTYIVQ
jgi:hypothetical protein